MEGERQKHKCTSEASDARRRGQTDDAQDCESQTDETKCVVGPGLRFGFGIVNLLHGLTMLTQKPRNSQQVRSRDSGCLKCDLSTSMSASTGRRCTALRLPQSMLSFLQYYKEQVYPHLEQIDELKMHRSCPGQAKRDFPMMRHLGG